MAIIPESQYPGKVAPSSASYPYGAARNITVPGDGTGTPWEAALVNDLFGHWQAILSEAGVVPSGTPETAEISQLLRSQIKLHGKKVATRAELRTIKSAQVSDGTVFSLTDTASAGNFIIKTGTVTDDDGALFVLDDDANRYLERQDKGFVLASWWAMDDSADETRVQAMDAYAAANNRIVLIDTDVDVSGFGSDFIQFEAFWNGNRINRVRCENIQWVNPVNASITNIVWEVLGAQSGGAIAGYGGTNGFVVKEGTSGNIDVCACTGKVTFTGNTCVHPNGTTNIFKTEACAHVVVHDNEFKGGSISLYGNKQHRCDAAFGISTADTDANVVFALIDQNIVDGADINDFDLIGVWGGVGGGIHRNIIKNGRYDGIDTYTAGEMMTVSGNIVHDCYRIGIQTKIDQAVNDRDSLGAGKNKRITVHDNVIFNIGPKSAAPASIANVTDICGTMCLFANDQNKTPVPVDSDFIHHVIFHDNIIFNVHDDDDYADPACRVNGMSMDAHASLAHHNLVLDVKRQPASSAANTGNAIAVNSVGVGPVNNITLDSNILSAEVNGIYINGTVSTSGRVNNINISNNRIFRSPIGTNQNLSNAGIFISPGVDDVFITGGSIDAGGPAVMLRRDFTNVQIKHITKITGDTHALQIEGYGTGLDFSDNFCAQAGDKVALITSNDANWDTLSSDWTLDNNKGAGGVNLAFSNTATGGLEGLAARSGKFPDDARMIIQGFDSGGGNILGRVNLKDNEFPDAVTSPCISLARASRIRARGNYCEAAGSVNLIGLSNSCEDSILAENEGLTAAGNLVSIGTAVNTTTRNNEII